MASSLFKAAGERLSHIIAAVSGGPDSVALLLALHEAGLERIVVAHCNFGLRGAESDGDQAFVGSLCERLGVECVVERCDVEGYRRANPGASVEMACRELRYTFFRRLSESTGIRYTAVAHNRQDRVETFFLNLMRSGGEAGLRGPKAANGNILRPMLDIDRHAIMDYLRAHGIEARTDSSNLAPVYARNKLRLNVLPRLREAFPGADTAICASMDRLAETEALIAALLEPKRRAYAREGSAWDIAALIAAEPMAEAVAYRLLKPAGFSRDITDAIVVSARAGHSGRIFSAEGRRWLLDRGVLSPMEEASPVTSRVIDIDACLRGDDPYIAAEIIGRDRFKPNRTGREAWFDADTILADSPRFELRPWCAGDRFTPFGMHGKRLVSDLLTDLHIPLADKPRVTVVTRNGAILWIPTLRASALFPVTPSTPRILHLTIK